MGGSPSKRSFCGGSPSKRFLSRRSPCKIGQGHHYEFTYQNEDNSFTLLKIILGVPGRAFWPRHDAQSALKKRPGRACARPVPSLMLTMKSETLSEVALQQEKATKPQTQTPSGSQVRSVKCTDHRSLRHQVAREQGRSNGGSSWQLFRGPAGPLGTTPHPCADG